MKEPRIDRLLFFSASTIAIIVCIPLGLIPEQADQFVPCEYPYTLNALTITLM